MTAEAQFLSAFFEELARANTTYCVLRNHEMLPFSLGSSDLDLLVLANEREHVAELLVSVATRHGGRVISEYATTGRYMKLLGCIDGEWWGAAVDLMPGLDYRGVVYLEAQPVIERAENFIGSSICQTPSPLIGNMESRPWRLCGHLLGELLRVSSGAGWVPIARIRRRSPVWR